MNFANPIWLLVWIVLPILAVAAYLLGRFKGQPWDQLTAERLRGRLIRNDHPLPRWLALGLLLAAMGAFAFSLARPQGDAGVKKETAKGRNVMIALDLSRSMRVADVTPDRLGQAKILIYEILDSLENDRVGLVGFAGTPFLFAPLTIDLAAVKETVEQIDEQWIPMGGSDISAAIKLSMETLKETGQKNNTLILISDGEENDGDLDAIVAEAESAGVAIFAIGIGTQDGGFVPHPDFSDGYLIDESGSKVLSRLQADVLRNLATKTGGRYVVAGRTGNIPAMIEQAIQGMDVFEMEGGQTKIVIEFFQWAALPGIFFLMASIVAGTRWRGLPALAVGGCFLMFAGESEANGLRDAKVAFSEGRYDQARDAYRFLAEERSGNAAARFRLAEGLAAYEAQDLRGARSAYSAALLSDETQIVAKAHEGLGNTLFQLGWMGLSGSRYPKGKAIPDMEQFDALVLEQLEKMGEGKIPETGETNGFARIDAIIVNWSDAIRHYRSAALKNPKDQAPGRNGEITLVYLKRLAELLDQEKQKTEQQMMQQQQQGEGEPREGEGEPKEGDGSGEPQEGDQGKGQDPSDQKEPGDKGDDEKEGKGNQPGEPEDGDGEEGEKMELNPNESPEDRARRLLKENSDIEKGPLSPGRRGFRNPLKDW